MNYNDNNTYINIFKDTKILCGKKPLNEAIEASAEKQKVYLDKESIACKKEKFNSAAKIIITKDRSLEAAGKYKGKNVAVLNFASACMPGGGVKDGSTAQEESLCRCSTLFFCLDKPEVWQSYYLEHRHHPNPLHDGDLIYTPDVVVFKTDTRFPVTMEQKYWYKVNVISSAAPNLRNPPSNRYNPYDGTIPASIDDEELRMLHENRARRILDAAAANGNQVVILGAFGCGAFRNDPQIVANAYRNILPEYSRTFETIEFAIPCIKDDVNYRIFSKILKKSGEN